MERDSLVKIKRETREVRNRRASLWHKRNKNKSLCTVAKARARKQGVPFALTPEDIVFPESCPVLGIPLFFTDNSRTDNTPTLDRVIPEKGYTPENVRVISWRANKLKSNGTLEELEKIVAYIKNSS